MWVDEGGIGLMSPTLATADEDRAKITGVSLHIV